MVTARLPALSAGIACFSVLFRFQQYLSGVFVRLVPKVVVPFRMSPPVVSVAFCGFPVLGFIIPDKTLL
jgi:hypothetical protein